jgi:hypothetical protein
MDASGSVRAFSVVPSSNPSQQEPKKSIHPDPGEAEVLSTCVRAGVCCLGIAQDVVLFQPVATTLLLPLAEFADPAKAIALIRAKVAEVGR